METGTQKHPLPDNFDLYLPWASNQMEGETDVVVIKTMQQEYINIGRTTERSKSKEVKSKVLASPTSLEAKSTSWRPLSMQTGDFVRIITTYDQNDQLVHIKFDNTDRIPRKMMKIIGMILKFHTHLTGVTINRGMDMYTVHELSSWLSISGITDICLDNTFVKEANYHILLETQNVLKNLSLVRCKITDRVIINIASKLFNPLPASKTLTLLNLSSNSITDLGAMYLSEALRTNRSLYYLNLADNMISDDGASRILNTLMEFPLMDDEIMEVRSKHMNYLNRKSQLSKRILKDLKVGDFEKRSGRKKIVKTTQSTPKKGKGVDRDCSAKSLIDGTGPTRSVANMEPALREKSEIMAENMLGRFNDPFATAHTKTIDGVTYCLGNNALCYLNLAYNNLSYGSVKKLLNVVVHQKMLARNPRGLVNVCIEGNNIPVQCAELTKIDEVLDVGLRLYTRKLSVSKVKSKGK